MYSICFSVITCIALSEIPKRGRLQQTITPCWTHRHKDNNLCTMFYNIRITTTKMLLLLLLLLLNINMKC